MYQPGAIRAGNLAAFGENNHVFVIVHPPAAAVPPPLDPTVCAAFGWVNTGCVAVFTHKGEERDEDRNHQDAWHENQAYRSASRNEGSR